jgi:hypothetical protein
MTWGMTVLCVSLHLLAHSTGPPLCQHSQQAAGQQGCQAQLPRLTSYAHT